MLLVFRQVQVANSNPYFDEIFALLPPDVRISAYRPLVAWQTADILHVHWLEGLLYKGPIQQRTLLAPILFKILDLTIDRVRRSGALVWTAHNIRPHEPPPAGLEELWVKERARFISRVDVAIAMSAKQLPILMAAYPDIRADAWRVATHPHYRSTYRNYSPRPWIRADLGIPNSAFLISMIGYVRRYKGILEAIRLFNETSSPDEYLLVAGDCGDPLLMNEITKEINSERVVTILRPISSEELASYYKASDLAFFNFRDVLNSGSILTALSLDVPVLAPNTLALKDISFRVGGIGWVNLFENPLSVESFKSQVLDVRTRRLSGRPYLESFAPELSAQQHVDAYRYALFRRFGTTIGGDLGVS